MGESVLDGYSKEKLLHLKEILSGKVSGIGDMHEAEEFFKRCDEYAYWRFGVSDTNLNASYEINDGCGSVSLIAFRALENWDKDGKASFKTLFNTYLMNVGIKKKGTPQWTESTKKIYAYFANMIRKQFGKLTDIDDKISELIENGTLSTVVHCIYGKNHTEEFYKERKKQFLSEYYWQSEVPFSYMKADEGCDSDSDETFYDFLINTSKWNSGTGDKQPTQLDYIEQRLVWLDDLYCKLKESGNFREKALFEFSHVALLAFLKEFGYPFEDDEDRKLFDKYKVLSLAYPKLDGFRKENGRLPNKGELAELLGTKPTTLSQLMKRIGQEVKAITRKQGFVFGEGEDEE